MKCKAIANTHIPQSEKVKNLVRSIEKSVSSTRGGIGGKEKEG